MTIAPNKILKPEHVNGKKRKLCAFFALLISRIFCVAQIAGWSLTGRVQRRVYLPIAYRSTRTIVSAGLLQVSHVARIAVANFIVARHGPLILHRVSNVIEHGKTLKNLVVFQGRRNVASETRSLAS